MLTWNTVRKPKKAKYISFCPDSKSVDETFFGELMNSIKSKIYKTRWKHFVIGLIGTFTLLFKQNCFFSVHHDIEVTQTTEFLSSKPNSLPEVYKDVNTNFGTKMRGKKFIEKITRCMILVYLEKRWKVLKTHKYCNNSKNCRKE